VSYDVPPTVNFGVVTLPVVGSTVAPAPNAAAVVDTALYSCEPFTASELVAFTVPLVSLVIFVLPDTPCSVIVSFDVLLS
jgi:hypothetical protein